MSPGWSELVTTALLGVTRRPLNGAYGPAWAPSDGPGDDALRLLDLAAAHRTVAELSGPLTAEAVEPQVAPAQRHPVAPARAASLLAELRSPPEPSLISYWLTSCVAARRSVPPAHWTWLARAAARSTVYDRALLGRALGESGRWFLRQNPDWRRLAADVTAGALTPPPPAGSGVGRSTASIPSAAELARQSDLIFAVADPWPVELVAAAWALLGSGALGTEAYDFAVAVGLRMPTEFYPRLADAAGYYLEAPDASPALRRAVRRAFVALERAAASRAQIAAAFAAPDQQTDMPFERLEIPYV